MGRRSLGAEVPGLQSWFYHRPLAPAVSPTEMSQSCPASSSSASPDAATGNRQEPPGDWRTWGLARSRPGPPGALRRQGHEESFCPGTLGKCHARRWLAQMPQAGPSKLTRGEEEAGFHQAFNYSDHAVLGLIASDTAGPSSPRSAAGTGFSAPTGTCPPQGTLTSLPAGAPGVVC